MRYQSIILGRYVLSSNTSRSLVVLTYAHAQAFVFFRDFILGSKDTGLVLDNGPVVGGEDPSLLVGDTGALPGQVSILYGSGTATSLYIAPSETIAPWDAFLSSVAAQKSETVSPTTESEAETITGSATTFAGPTSSS